MNNLLIAFEGMRSAVACMVEGYRGPGTYAARCSVQPVIDPLALDPSGMLPGSGGASLSGSFRVDRDVGGHLSGGISSSASGFDAVFDVLAN